MKQGTDRQVIDAYLEGKITFSQALTRLIYLNYTMEQATKMLKDLD